MSKQAMEMALEALEMPSARSLAEAAARNIRICEAIGALKEAIKQQGEPVAWIRFCSDGCYEGPIMNSQIEDVRKASGAWTPLYTSAPSYKGEQP